MTTVGRLMTREVVTLLEEDGLARAVALFAEHPFRHLPVVDGRRLVGMVSHRDTLRWSGSELEHHLGSDAQKRSRETFVAETMIRDVVTVTAESSVVDAARAMLDGGFGALPVVDDAGDLVGLITETDLLRHLISDELSQARRGGPPSSRPLSGD